MGKIRLFLESSTIHGLTYISTTRKYVKLFWIIVVLTGFTGAGILIYESFQAWDESPVTTTIETLPITEITFPKVTVCPPKNTFTNLNYDIMRTEKMTLDNDTRNKLSNYATKLLLDALHKEIMDNVSTVLDENMFYNWYHGLSSINIPYNSARGLSCVLTTFATTGSISTQYFGDKFDIDKLSTNYEYVFTIRAPTSVKDNLNLTLHFEVEKNSMLGDKFKFGYISIKEDVRYFTKNYSGKNVGGSYRITVRSKVSKEDVKKLNLKLMPGFSLRWYYTGGEVEKYSNFDIDLVSKSFIRNHT